MATTIPTHYHQFPRASGIQTVYPEGLPVWDVVNKRILVGDGTTAGGIVIAKQGDELSYVRKTVAGNTQIANRDWIICTAAATLTLPATQAYDIYCKVTTTTSATVIVKKADSTTIDTFTAAKAVEYLGKSDGTWVRIDVSELDSANLLHKADLQFNNSADNQIVFRKCTATEYAGLTPVTDSIYWLTDTGQIYLNNRIFGADCLVFCNTFPSTGTTGKLYVNTVTKEIRAMNNGSMTTVVLPPVTVVSEGSLDTTVATSKAVYTFVVNYVNQLRPLDSLIVSFVDHNFTAVSGYFYICTQNLSCRLPSGTSNAIVKVMAKDPTTLVTIAPATGETIDGDSDGFVLDTTNASVTLLWESSEWKAIQY